MKLTILENTPKVFSFKLDKVSTSFANAIRRIAINSVPSFAIDSVTFYENSSAIFDEYIAHRIGLVPIVTPNGYDEKDEVLFKLEAEGPGTVYSKSLESNDRSVKVANPNIPIIKLAEGQKLRIDAKAIIGTGARSAKFQTGIVTYKQLTDTSFEFYVETFGQIPAPEILTKTLGIITNNVKEVYKELK
ncbi:MAG TPA: DNA-directed RNA polymerase subunit D [Candidatus Saccharimonadales bacterium]|nr:DNA-directed RNA polymerase subunit D [Candidatus Saccharimonadales bacterium]